MPLYPVQSQSRMTLGVTFDSLRVIWPLYEYHVIPLASFSRIILPIVVHTPKCVIRFPFYWYGMIKHILSIHHIPTPHSTNHHPQWSTIEIYICTPFSSSDLWDNKLKILYENSFTNMDNLLTLRLHSQKPKMTNIYYSAFWNINKRLKDLWVLYT